MQLQTLLNGVVDNSQDCWISGLSIDSRKINKQGEAFIALHSANQNTVTYVEQALANGAVAILYDTKDSVLATWLMETQAELNHKKTLNDCIFIAINALDTQLSAIASRYYAEPSHKLDVIGITGTNGKTSCSQFLGQLVDNCGIIGTLGWGAWGDLTVTGYTTPDALATQAILSELVTQGQHAVAMEVSSHGLAEGRVNSLKFKGVVLTNISRDHLDFHGSMAAYIDAKKSLFTRADNEFAVINLDDALSSEFIAVIPKQVNCWGYEIVKPGSSSAVKQHASSVKPGQYVYAQHISHQADGMAFELIWQDQLQAVKVPLYGDFNVENILAVVTVMLALDYSLETVAAKLQTLNPVDGRMQRFGTQQSALIFVDYAHTPDALEKALTSARQHCKRALWVVFGCGGDRDTGKRSQMGACAQRYADHIIITDDNPRSENPEAITQDILSGCQSNNAQRVQQITVIHNREQAIQTAIKQAAPEDCILIAGKGHERYQEYSDRKIPFSDAQVVMNQLSQAAINQ